MGKNGSRDREEAVERLCIKVLLKRVRVTIIVMENK
jgi:hypothetical protein